MERGGGRTRLAAAVVALVIAASGCGADDGATTLAAAGSSGDRPAPGPVEPAPAPAPRDDGGVGEITVEIEPASSRTPEAEAEAEELRRSVLAEADRRGWSSAERAAADGYEPMALDPSHWYHPDYVTDDRFFDPAAPEFLVIDGDEVMGVMFLAEEAGLDQPDPPGAPLVRWHYHRWSEDVCLADGLVITGETVAGACGEGEVATDISPLMAHVWLLDLDDPFATDMAAHDHEH